jgi:hypothetical protein
MTQPQTVGASTGGKPINLHQLEAECGAAGVQTNGLGMANELVYVYDADGGPANFPVAEQATVDQVIADHVALRDKTSAEYAAEFQDPETAPARKQEIRDIQNGLLPPEQVPISQEEWNAR